MRVQLMDICQHMLYPNWSWTICKEKVSLKIQNVRSTRSNRLNEYWLHTQQHLLKCLQTQCLTQVFKPTHIVICQYVHFMQGSGL